MTRLKWVAVGAAFAFGAGVLGWSCVQLGWVAELLVVGWTAALVLGIGAVVLLVDVVVRFAFWVLQRDD